MKVLIAVDESHLAEEAFQWYVEHFHRPSHEIVIVHEGEQPRLPSLYITEDGPHLPHKEIMNLIQKSNQRMEALREKYDIKCEKAKTKHKSFFQTTEKSAGEKIVSIANEEGCDVIVIGSRGQSLMKRTILGSVSSYVLHHSKVPILVYPKN